MGILKKGIIAVLAAAAVTTGAITAFAVGGNEPAPKPTTSVDAKGPCDEAEHANDARCDGAQGAEDRPSADGRNDDKAGANEAELTDDRGAASEAERGDDNGGANEAEPKDDNGGVQQANDDGPNHDTNDDHGGENSGPSDNSGPASGGEDHSGSDNSDSGSGSSRWGSSGGDD
ncbi:MAG: hypothetical protein ACJ76P_10405 [Actinomycetota bacterium]